VIDFRLYRLCFLPALLAVIVVMFSLEGTPDALEPVTPPSTFDGGRAAAAARQIATTAPDRTAGSEADAAIADLVVNRFEDIPAGAVSEQRFTASDDGEDVSLRNVLLTLPGDAGETIVIVAARDSAHGPGAASSAAATGILVELANAFRVSHTKTFVLASISGSTAGGSGIRALIDGLPERDAISAVIVISQPGSLERKQPYVVGSSTGAQSASVQLERTAERAVEVQAGEPPHEDGAFTQLARLAIPSGLGDQAPLIADGIPAIAISSAGERPLSSEADQLDDLAPKSVDDFGRAIQSTVAALDVATAGPVHGPPAHLELGDNLVPGWALAALALALILPAAVAAVDACARAGRQSLGLGPALAWAAARSLPFVGALAALYLLAIFGAVPRPGFPFDPGLYGLGARAAIAFAVMAVVAAASAWSLRRRGVSAGRAPESTVCALGGIAAGACVGLWLINPYLAVVAAPLAHVWLLAAGGASAARRALAVVASALACVPLLAAAAAVAGALDLGVDAPWTYSLMVADGQIGLLTMLMLCFLAGVVAGVVALALRRRGDPETG
jgi:hypothetical protein